MAKFSSRDPDTKLIADLRERRARLREELTALDREIAALSASTKTFFHGFGPVHNHLRLRWRWYHDWHLWPYHKECHLGVLFIALATFTATLFLAASPSLVGAVYHPSEEEGSQASVEQPPQEGTPPPSHELPQEPLLPGAGTGPAAQTPGQAGPSQAPSSPSAGEAYVAPGANITAEKDGTTTVTSKSEGDFRVILRPRKDVGPTYLYLKLEGLAPFSTYQVTAGKVPADIGTTRAKSLASGSAGVKSERILKISEGIEPNKTICLSASMQTAASQQSVPTFCFTPPLVETGELRAGEIGTAGKLEQDGIAATFEAAKPLIGRVGVGTLDGKPKNWMLASPFVANVYPSDEAAGTVKKVTVRFKAEGVANPFIAVDHEKGGGWERLPTTLQDNVASATSSLSKFALFTEAAPVQLGEGPVAPAPTSPGEKILPGPVATTVKTIAQNPTVQASQEEIAAVAVFGAASAAALPLLANAPLALSPLGVLLYSLLQASGLAGLFGRRRRAEVGVVYDAQTKQPIPGVVVQLFDAEFNRLLAQEVTDRLGQFSFVPKPGNYYLRVARASYEFPSKLVTGRSDGSYSPIYRGDSFTLKTSEPITFAIPLDPNQSRLIGRLSLVKSLGILSAIVRLPLFAVGTVFTASLSLTRGQPFDYVLLAFYLILWVVEVARLLGPRTAGRVVDAATQKGLDLAIVRLFSPERRLLRTVVTNQAGLYKLVAQQGEYVLAAFRAAYQPFEAKVRIRGPVTKEIALTRARE